MSCASYLDVTQNYHCFSPARIFPALGQPSNSLFLLATAYRTVCGVAGAYITPRLAPTRPMLHAVVLGSLGLAASTVGAVVTWNSVPSLGSHWGCPV